MENKVADNWECANALERFKQFKIDILEKRNERGKDYLKTVKFKNLIPVKKLKVKDQVKELEDELVEMKKFYDAVYAMVKRHESVVDELARIYVGIGDSILSEGKFPKELFSDQAKIMDEYYESLQEILKPCKLEE